MIKALILFVAFLAVELACGGLSRLAGMSQGVTVLLANVLVLLYMLWWRRLTPQTERLETSRRQGANIWIAVLGVMLVLLVWVNFLLEALGLPDWTKDMDIEALYSDWVFVVAAVLVGPVAEEMVFRMGMIDAMKSSKSKVVRGWAVALAAVLFAVAHFNPAQSAGALLLGLFFGWVYVRTRSLALPIACHILNNGASILWAHLTGFDYTLEELTTKPYKLWAMVVAGAIIVAVFLIGLDKMFSNAEARRQEV